MKRYIIEINKYDIDEILDFYLTKGYRFVDTRNSFYQSYLRNKPRYIVGCPDGFIKYSNCIREGSILIYPFTNPTIY